MGSDLYVSIQRQYPNGDWSTLFDGPSTALDRGIVVDAFGNTDPEDPISQASGYIAQRRWAEMANHPECPWRLDVPYWIRLIDGAEFVAIIRLKRWQYLQDGDYTDHECSPELRAFASLVESLLNEYVPVRVYAWHSQ